MTWSDEDEQPGAAPSGRISPTKWWEIPLATYEAPATSPEFQDAETFKRTRPRPDARQDASVRGDDSSDADDDELRMNTIINKFGQPSPTERAHAVTPEGKDEHADAWDSPRPRADALPLTPTRRKAAFASRPTAYAKRMRRVCFADQSVDTSDVTALVAQLRPLDDPDSPLLSPPARWRASPPHSPPGAVAGVPLPF